MFSEYIDFFDFSTFRPIVGRSNWSILLNILHFFVFSTFGPWREEGDAKNWPEGKIHGASVRSNIKNTVSVNLKAVCNIQYPEKTKHARTKEGTLLLLTFFLNIIGDTETGYFSETPEINIGIIISLVLCIRSKRGVLIVSQTFKILTSPIIRKLIRFSISIPKTMHLL